MNDTKMYDILKCFSKHLSYYKGEYTIVIHENMIAMYPDILVFPDRYHRRKTEKETLVYHIFDKHYSMCISQIVDAFSIILKNVKDLENDMMYNYSYSMNNRCRKWIRII